MDAMAKAPVERIFTYTLDGLSDECLKHAISILLESDYTTSFAVTSDGPRRSRRLRLSRNSYKVVAQALKLEHLEFVA